MGHPTAGLYVVVFIQIDFDMFGGYPHDLVVQHSHVVRPKRGASIAARNFRSTRKRVTQRRKLDFVGYVHNIRLLLILAWVYTPFYGQQVA